MGAQQIPWSLSIIPKPRDSGTTQFAKCSQARASIQGELMHFGIVSLGEESSLLLGEKKVLRNM